MNCRTVQWGAFPSLQRRGGCGINKKSRSHRSAADGVVAYKPMFQNVFRNITCERPPRPRRFRNGTIFDGADTPPSQGLACPVSVGAGHGGWTKLWDEESVCHLNIVQTLLPK